VRSWAFCGSLSSPDALRPPRFGGSGGYPVWYRQIQLEKFHAGEAIEVSLASIYRWDVRRTDDLTINKGGG
jgi:hypothetical protein